MRNSLGITIIISVLMHVGVISWKSSEEKRQESHRKEPMHVELVQKKTSNQQIKNVKFEDLIGETEGKEDVSPFSKGNETNTPHPESNHSEMIFKKSEGKKKVVSKQVEKKLGREDFLRQAAKKAAYLVYPKEARLNGWEGSVGLYIIFNGEGEVADVQILKSSGFPSLDLAATMFVKKLGGKGYSNKAFSIPIGFSLEN